jgi:hypothetical protein
VIDITIPVKKLYGILCARSNSQRAYLQMLARCRRVEDPRIEVLNDPILKVNNNYNFWRYDEVLELNRNNVEHTSPEFFADGDYLMLSDNDRNKRRKNISIYNRVEKLNKSPSIYINYRKMLVQGKGMDSEIEEGEEGAPSVSKPKNYRVAAIMEAPDIDHDRVRGPSAKKSMGRRRSRRTYQVRQALLAEATCARRSWSEAVLKAHLYRPGLFWNFLSLIDMRNYTKQDNLSSAKHVREGCTSAQKLLEGLGFASPMDARGEGPRGVPHELLHEHLRGAPLPEQEADQ